MRMTDRRGVEYEVTYDAERELYVYVKVFKPYPEPNLAGDALQLSVQSPSHEGQSERQA